MIHKELFREAIEKHFPIFTRARTRKRQPESKFLRFEIGKVRPPYAIVNDAYPVDTPQDPRDATHLGACPPALLQLFLVRTSVALWQDLI